MKHLIFNLNSLNNYQKKTFRTLNDIYLSTCTEMEDGGMLATWSENLSQEVMIFDTVEDAWNFVYKIWGFDYSRTNFSVMSVTDESLAKAKRERQAFFLFEFKLPTEAERL